MKHLVMVVCVVVVCSFFAPSAMGQKTPWAVLKGRISHTVEPGTPMRSGNHNEYVYYAPSRGEQRAEKMRAVSKSFQRLSRNVRAVELLGLPRNLASPRRSFDPTNQTHKRMDALKLSAQETVIAACEKDDVSLIKDFPVILSLSGGIFSVEDRIEYSHFISPLVIAIENEAINVAKYLIEIAAENPFVRYDIYGTGRAAAALAAKKGQTEIVELLAKQGIVATETDFNEIQLDFRVPTLEDVKQKQQKLSHLGILKQ